MPPRKRAIRTSLAAEDQAVASRLREVRNYLRFSQSEFAQQLEISRAALSSYEELRVAVQWELALKICRQFIVSEEWLAIGGTRVGGELQSVDFGHLISRRCFDLYTLTSGMEIPENTQYSSVYRNFLSKEYAQLQERLTHVNYPQIRFIEPCEIDLVRNILNYVINDLADQVYPDAKMRFLANLCDSGVILHHHLSNFLKWEEPTQFEEAIQSAMKPVETDTLYRWACQVVETTSKEGKSNPSKPLHPDSLKMLPPSPLHATRQYSIDNESAEVYLSGVSFRVDKWKELQRRLINVTKPRGKKTELAKFLGLTRQAIARWTASEDAMPRGKHLLQLLEWVQTEEANQKQKA